jgi:hypothetical protein
VTVQQVPLSYWDTFADAYGRLDTPLTPSTVDLRVIEEAIEAWMAARNATPHLRALLLGVTPALAQMRLPEGSWLLAIDRSWEMASRIWPGDIRGSRWVVCADWMALPERPSSVDVVLADGSINCLRYPDGFRRLAASVREHLTDEGIFVLRSFVQPERQEEPLAVFGDLLQSPSFHHFKLRLLMAMQHSVERGIPVNDVYRFWTSREMDRDRLISRTGWPGEVIDTIELHRGPNTVFTFPRLDELRSVLSGFFTEVSCTLPGYPLGDRCPILVLRPDARSRRSVSQRG